MPKNKIARYFVKGYHDLDTIVHLLKNNWIFRGHENSEWGLLTGYDRIKQDEQNCSNTGYDRNIREFQGIELAKQLLHKNVSCQNLSRIEILALLQHYGTKTRLLDFTFSFYVALFFAYENPKRVSRSIWCINLDRLIEKDIDTLKNEEINNVLYQPNTNDQKKEENIGFNAEEKSEQRWQYREKVTCNNNHLIREHFNEKANQCITDHANYDGTEHPQTVYPVFCEGNNDRINAQNGLFLFPTDINKSFIENIEKALDVDMDEKKWVNINKKMWEDTNEPEPEKKKIQKKIYENTISPYPIIKIIFDPDFSLISNEILIASNLSSRIIYPDMEGLAKSIHL